MEIRKLKAKDLYTVGTMIRKALPTLVEQGAFRSGASDSPDPERQSEVGKAVFRVLLDECYDDLWAWLADMAGMSSDEFGEQPLDAPLDVIEALVKDESFADFYKRVLRLINSDL